MPHFHPTALAGSCRLRTADDERSELRDDHQRARSVVRQTIRHAAEDESLDHPGPAATHDEEAGPDILAVLRQRRRRVADLLGRNRASVYALLRRAERSMREALASVKGKAILISGQLAGSGCLGFGGGACCPTARASRPRAVHDWVLALPCSASSQATT